MTGKNCSGQKSEKCFQCIEKHTEMQAVRDIGHCLFLKAHSFPRVLLLKNCSLLGLDNIPRQTFKHIFEPNIIGLVEVL